MTTVQLRRYRMEPARLNDFLAWFAGLPAVREQYGFRVLFALADPARQTFTWAVSHDGDETAFTSAEARYNASPERAEVFATFPACIAESEVGFVDDVLAG